MPTRVRSKRSCLRKPGGLGAIVTAALAIVLLIARFALASHYLLVAHSLCEHGDLTHATREDSAREAAPASGEQIEAAPASAEADHDHCDANALRHLPDEQRAPILAATLLAVLEPPTRANSAEHQPIPLLHLAPKSSPPKGSAAA